MKQENSKKKIKIIIVCALFCVSYIIFINYKNTNSNTSGILYAEDIKAENKADAGNKKTLNSKDTLNTSTKPDSLFVEEIKQKDLELQKREEQIGKEEEKLKIIKADIEQKIAQLNALKSELDEIIKKVDAKHLKELKHLVSVLEAMKPEESAAVFEGLPINDAVNIILMMNEKKAGKILGVVKSEKAVQITELINKKKK